jgi:hypothetical protein
MKATVLAEISSHFIFSLGYLHYKDVYRHESGRCRSLHFFLTFFKSELTFLNLNILSY